MSENTLRKSQALELHSTPATFSYSDGDDAENYLLRVITEARDISLGSKELAAAIRDWPSDYHLNPMRGNLLKGFQFPAGARALEIGAGCGAITRLLGEAGLSVTAVEGSERRSQIAVQRCRDLDNVEVITSNIIDFRSDEKFDFVFLIGVLEYSPSFIPGANPVGTLLTTCRTFLKKEGALVVAIENQLGLKYLNGAPEDHIGRPYWGVQNLYGEKSPVTFGREQLESTLSDAGFTSVQAYFPFPDYKLPEVVVSQRGLDAEKFRPGELLHQNYSSGNGQTYSAAFDEPLTWSVLGRNGLISDLANSFLFFASEKKRAVEPWLAKCFSNRNTVTSFVEDESGAISVLKGGQVSADAGAFIRKNETASYVTGMQYQNDLRRALMRGGSIAEIATWARPWFELLSGFASDGYLPEDFVDCVPYNIVVKDSGELEYIDREWVAKEKPPLAWIFIRGILHSLWRCGWKGELAGRTYRQAIIEIGENLGFALTPEHFLQADQLEAKLILSAAGEAASTSSALDLKIENTIQLWRENVTGQLNLLSRAKLEIDSRDARLNELQKEVERLEELEVERGALLLERETLTQLAHARGELLERERALRAKNSADSENEIRELRERLTASEQLIGQVMSSKSWKMTAPLRKFSEKFSSK